VVKSLSSPYGEGQAERSLGPERSAGSDDAGVRAKVNVIGNQIYKHLSTAKSHDVAGGEGQRPDTPPEPGSGPRPGPGTL
jgi:hypothetical protein